MDNQGEIPRCRAAADVTYLSHGVTNLPTDTRRTMPLRKILRIETASDPLMEDMTMSKTKNGKKTTEAKTEKAAKKREPKEKAPLRTVAVRIPENEFQLLHRAAGPRQ